MHTFQINALIRFLAPFACLEPHGLIIRKTAYRHAWKTYRTKTTCINSLPEDEPTRFETWRQQKLNINLKIMRFSGLSCIIVSQ
jgi:hypothetical protein